MSYVRSCNVDAVKTFDLRLRDSNNVSPGLYSTLTAGPQQVYGTPLSWEYILLLSDVQGVKVNLSSFISIAYKTLSTETAYISTYLQTNISTLSSFLNTNYITLENSNIYLNATLLYDVSNFYLQTCNLPYPNITTIQDTTSTLSSYIKKVITTLAVQSTVSTFFSYQLSSANKIYEVIQPSISTISSLNIIYSTNLHLYLLNNQSNLQSTVSTSIYNFVTNQSSFFYTFNSTLSNTSSYVASAYSTQYLLYSTINGNFLNSQTSTVKSQFSSFSTILGFQYSTVNYLYTGSMLSTVSAAQASLTASINANFSTLNSSFSGALINVSTTLSTTQTSVTDNNSILFEISSSQNSYINGISNNIAVLYNYNTVNRPQTFFEVDFNYNGSLVSSNLYPSSLTNASLATEQANALSYLQTLYSLNSTNLASLYQSNVSNAYYEIIKVYRANNIPLIDTLCNSVFTSTFVSSFGYPSSLSTAFGNYSTQVKSTILQNYKLFTQSERLQISNICNIYEFSVSSFSLPIFSSATAQAYTSLSNEMKLLTSTNLRNLTTYTFNSYRSNSELTIQIINDTLISNNIILSNGNQEIIDHILQDGFYRNLSTLFNYNFSTSKGLLTSTSFNLINTDSTFTRYLPQSTFSTYIYQLSSYSTITFNQSRFSTIMFNLSTLSTAINTGDTNVFNYSTFSTIILNQSSFSTVNYNLSSYSTIFLNSTINIINYSNLSTFVSTQLTYLPIFASTLSTYLQTTIFSSLSTSSGLRNLSLSNFILSTSNTLNTQLITLSNEVDTFNAGQASVVSSFVSQCNSRASNILSTTFGNSISLQQNQIILSTFTTLSSIFINNKTTTVEAGANLTLNSRSPLEINFYDNRGYHNLLYVNPTKNEVIGNNVVIVGSNQITFSNTVSTLSLDLNQYQNFHADVSVMSNANPTIELTVNVSTLSKRTQQGYIHFNLNVASANEIAAGKFLNIINLGPTIRLDITRLSGYLKYKYLCIGGQAFISQSNNFTATTNITIPAGSVTTITNTSTNNFVGIVTDSLGNLFVTDINTNSVYKFNITTLELSVFATGFNIPYNLTIDGNNNLYVASFADNLIYKITQAGVKSTLISIPTPVGVVVDSTATFLYASSLSTHNIYKITLSTNTSTVFVGTGSAGYADGTGVVASFGLVFGMTIDSSQDLYVTDYVNNSIRKINLATAQVVTIAGSTTGQAGSSIEYPIGNTESLAGTSALFNRPTGILADNLGNLFICDSGNFAIRQFALTNYQIITISGGLNKGSVDGLISIAGYSQLNGITINSDKTNFFACDVSRIRQIGYNINAITGSSAISINAATQAEAGERFCVTLIDSNPNLPVFRNLVLDTSRKIFILAVNGVIYKYDPVFEALTVFATLSSGSSYYGITIDSSNNLYVTDGISTIYKITAAQAITTFKTGLDQPRAIATNNTNLYVTLYAQVIQIVISSGAQTTLAGTGAPGYQDGLGSAALFDSQISGVTTDGIGNLFVTEYNNQTIRSINLTTNQVATTAGKFNIPGNANGIGINAQFSGPIDVKTDFNGALYVSDYSNNLIRKLDTGSLVVTTLAGNSIFNTYPSATNPDGIVNQAKLFGPYGLALDNPTSGSIKDLYLIDGQGKLLRSFFRTFSNSLSTMSTMIGNDVSSITSYQTQISTAIPALTFYNTLTGLQNISTNTAYNTTFATAYSIQKAAFLNSASNAVLDSAIQFLSTQRASTIGSQNFISVNQISTGIQSTIISWIGNVYSSNASNLLINVNTQVSNAFNSFETSLLDRITAESCATAASNALSATLTVSNYSFTGGNQFFVVPTGVTTLTVNLLGAGGSTAYTGGAVPEAQGGFVYGNLPVTAGTNYTLVVGGQTNVIGTGNFGGGASGGGGFGGSGGGRSAISLAGQDVVTAGGGGGNAQNTAGGAGGGTTARSGAGGAGGGTQVQGGAASGVGASAGTLQSGGVGSSGGGGGGGGYYGGGGGGGSGLAGGGGSSFITNLGGLIINTIAGGAFSGPNASSSTPPTTGHGSIIISFTASGGGGGIISAIPETYSFNFNSYTQYSAIFSPTSSNISVPT